MIYLQVEEQYKKALEEDPSVFDYDGVYDDMKAKVVQPKAQDREQRQVIILFIIVFGNRMLCLDFI